MGRYTRGGYVYDAAECPAAIADLMLKAQQSNDTAAVYERIGYQGHAASARTQADRLAKAASKVMRGDPVSDYETRRYNG